MGARRSTLFAGTGYWAADPPSPPSPSWAEATPASASIIPRIVADPMAIDLRAPSVTAITPSC